MTDSGRKWIRYFVDFSSPLSFLLVYFLGGKNLMQATGVSVVVGVLALAVGFLVERRLAWLPLFVAVTGIIFGGLTLIFDAAWIIKSRPTFLNLTICGLLVGGVALKKNPLGAVLGWAVKLPDAAWRTLALRYGAFSAFIAITNTIIWLTQTEEVWVTWDTIGIRVLAAIMGIAQMPLLMRYMKAEETPPPPPTAD
jgi:intracellular septation protein